MREDHQSCPSHREDDSQPSAPVSCVNTAQILRHRLVRTLGAWLIWMDRVSLLPHLPLSIKGRTNTCILVRKCNDFIYT